MNILITGATGFIGRNLAEHLAHHYDLLTPRRGELDLLDECSVDAYFKRHTVDVVIHTACKPGHRNATDPTGIFYADTRMYFTLMRNRDFFGKMIITGSGAVYDMRKYHPKICEPQWKDVIPEDEHGFFRHVTAHHIETTPGVVDLRLFGVFGKYEDYAIRFISNSICKSLFDSPITIRQNRKFDYLYIDDLFPVVEHLIGHDVQYHEYNVTPDNSISLYDLAEKVLVVAGKDLPILIVQEGMGMEYSGDNSRLKREIQGIAFTPIIEAIRCLYSWYEKNIHLLDRDKLLTDK